MDEKKYEMTDDVIEVNGHTLHRIKALKSFGDVKAGDVGGYIETEHNLWTVGNAWVYDDAIVFGDAQVINDARVKNNAKVFGNAMVEDTAIVSHDACVYGDAIIAENARVLWDAIVEGKARVHGQAYIGGDAVVCDNAWVDGTANVNSNAKICGDARINGNAQISKDAYICNNQGLLVVGPVVGRHFNRNVFITLYTNSMGGITVIDEDSFAELKDYASRVRGLHIGNEYLAVRNMIVELAKLQMKSINYEPMTMRQFLKKTIREAARNGYKDCVLKLPKDFNIMDYVVTDENVDE